MNKDYIYQSSKNSSSTNKDKIILVLPDIFGQTNYAKQTCEDFAGEFGMQTYLLDYFYKITGTSNTFEPSDQAKAAELMQRMTGEDFITIFERALKDIVATQPDIKQIIVVGFCFAGRLAYLTGENSLVSTIISFYGAGANTTNFIEDKTPIEFLVVKRGDDEKLRVESFFGTEDDSIPQIDRELIKSQLENSKITYNSHEYHSGHAYFQPGRPNYNQEAAEASWQEIHKILR